MNENKNKELQTQDKKESQIAPYDKEFSETIIAFQRAIAATYQEISQQKTKHRAKKRKIAAGKYEDYLEGSYMTAALDKYFPGWNYLPAHDPYIVPVKQGEKLLIISGGILEIIDIKLFKSMVALGIPPERAPFTRRFYGLGGGMYHASKETGNVIHDSNPAKKSITEGLKFAINRLTHFGDDTYSREESEVLTLEQYKELFILVEKSNLPESEKDIAREKILEINQKQIERFKEVLKEKEQEFAKESEK